MKTYVCDVCKTNRSDEGTVYHLTVEKISPDGNKFTQAIESRDICEPCFKKMFKERNV